MEPGKTIRYNTKLTYYTEGTSGAIMKNSESNTVIKLVRTTNDLATFDNHTKHLVEYITMLKLYTLAPQNIPRIYDFGFMHCTRTTSRMFLGTKKEVLSKINDKICNGIVMDLVINDAELTQPYATSIIAQLFWVAHCINKLGFVHRDLYWRNIIISRTDKKTIQCGNEFIPSNGYEVKVLDFGEICKTTVCDSMIDVYTIISIMFYFEDYYKFLNGQRIQLKPSKTILKNIKGIPVKSIFGQTVWCLLNCSDRYIKLSLGDKYMFDFKPVFRVDQELLKELVLMKSALECFNHVKSKMKSVKGESILEYNYNKSEVDKLIVHHTEVRFYSPYTFAPIKYCHLDGIEYELPVDAGIKPLKKWIDEVIKALDIGKFIITKFDKSNYVVNADRVIVLYDLQHIVKSTKFGKCEARKLLKSII